MSKKLLGAFMMTPFIAFVLWGLTIIGANIWTEFRLDIMYFVQSMLHPVLIVLAVLLSLFLFIQGGIMLTSKEHDE